MDKFIYFSFFLKLVLSTATGCLEARNTAEASVRKCGRNKQFCRGSDILKDDWHLGISVLSPVQSFPGCHLSAIGTNPGTPGPADSSGNNRGLSFLGGPHEASREDADMEAEDTPLIWMQAFDLETQIA